MGQDPIGTWVSFSPAATWSQSLVERCASYTEVTPSGTGLRIIGFAPEVQGAVDRRVKHPEGGSFELYACPQARFITVTGDRLPSAPDHRGDISVPFLELLAMAPDARAARSPLPWKPANDGARIDPSQLDPTTFAMVSEVYDGEDRSRTLMRVVGDLKEQGYGPASITELMRQFEEGPGLQKYGHRLEREVARAWEKADDPPPLVEVAADELPPHDPETGELTEPAGELPAELTQPPGLLGEIVDWIVATGRRPHRVLALGAAITTLGTLIGRRTAGPTRSGTHLYVVALAPSGSGKDHPLRAPSRLLKAANSAELVGPDEFISMPAVVNFLMRKPLSLCAMDEIGAFIKRLTHHRASIYEQSVTKLMRSVWGTSFEAINTPEWAGKESVEIFAPALSIYGASTPDEFFEALQGSDVVNGFLNRFLLLTSDSRVADRKPALASLEVPRSLAERLAKLRRETERRAPDKRNMIVSEFTEYVVPWADPEAERIYEDLKERLEPYLADSDVKDYFARTAEMAVRLATIVAVGDNPARPTVKAAHMRWGADLALWSAQRMQKLAKGHIAENETQRLFNHILRIIERRGWAITHRNLQVALHGKVKSRELADTMKTLQEAGYVEAVRTVPPSGCLPPSSTAGRARGRNKRDTDDTNEPTFVSPVSGVYHPRMIQT